MASTYAEGQTLASAAARLRDASKHRAKMLKDQGLEVWDQARTKAPTYWQEYKPRTLLQWTVSPKITLGYSPAGSPNQAVICTQKPAQLMVDASTCALASGRWHSPHCRGSSVTCCFHPLLVLLQGFGGVVLLAISALSTVLNILGGITLGMAWIGLVVYFVTVSSSTVAAFFCGSAMMMFSATTAIMGSSILAGEVIDCRQDRLAAAASTTG